MKAQDLLVNGGFEDENTCTEYKVNCAPEGWLTNDDVFFNYFKDANRAHSGFHCMAIEAGHAKKRYRRTFIRSQLVCGLHEGNQYAIDFFIKSPHQVLDSIGIYFTSYDFLFEKTQLQHLKPTFYLSDAGINFRHDSSWQEVKFLYTATGNESFLTIGNFSQNDITGDTHIKMENVFFVFIDDISLLPVNRNETLCDQWLANKERIYEQDERHEFLRRKIKQGMSAPLQTVKIMPAKLSVADTLLLPDILFENAKSGLRTGSYPMLDSICNKIQRIQVDSIVINGHTDNRGGAEMNERLSSARANTVRQYIHARTGYDSIIVRGKSFFEPVADNETPEGRQKNRRVEIILYTRQ